MALFVTWTFPQCTPLSLIPLSPKIDSMTAYCHSMHIKRDRVSLNVMQWFIINLGSTDVYKKIALFTSFSA